jgi:hypoxanthine phosphoribosyltransferase
MPERTSFWREHVSVLYDEAAVAGRVRAMGAEITRDFEGTDLWLIGILKGSFVFFADLARTIELPLRCEFIGISSYGDATQTSGVVQITRDLGHSIEGKDVLIVEDIIDTGLTMQYLLDNLHTRRPRQIKVCSLLHKPSNARVHVPIDYLGFTIPKSFVVGYGLDFAGLYRNLPFIGVYHGPA